MKKNLIQIFIALGLLTAFAAPRLVALDRFATVDEPYWLAAGSDFYYALGQRAFANTIYDYHPAVTTMWIITAGMLAYFPQYRGFGQGYFDVYKDSLERFLLTHGRTPLGLLTVSRVIQTAVIVGLLLVTFWLLRRLLGDKIALVGVLLISFDPFFLGHSRLLNHEGMLSLFVLISLLAILAYLFFDRKLVYLLLSGAAAGLAQLTKSSSIVLVPVIGLLLLVDVFLRHDAGWGRRLLGAAAKLALWVVALAVVYVILWPGMWVAPGEMLYQVYGNAFSYAFQGARLSVTGEVQPAQFSLHLGDIKLYLISILSRTTPIAWIGFLFGLVALVRQKLEVRIALLSIVLLGVLFILLFGVASGRNSLHYVLASFVALDILAAAGWAHALEWLAGSRSRLREQWVSALVLAAVVVIQAANALGSFPYYYTYYNPIMEALQPGRQNPGFGYGEGLELAAAYLNGKSDPQDMTVMAYYGRGPFSYFFAGKTEPLKSVYADAENVPQLLEKLNHSDYMVIYYVVQKGRNQPANVMAALEGATPERSIPLNGIEYIRIYKVADLPPGFWETVQKQP